MTIIFRTIVYRQELREKEWTRYYTFILHCGFFISNLLYIW